ncbi:hypothetical protein M0R45_006130 [Rubus argutus]|uniref:Agglutinin domain-containing protein n=1 Tax=Rubus argutus TaxID=59490 RepID=A0AAW1YQ25_RUBAR
MAGRVQPLTDGRIININSGKQGDLFKGVGGDVFTGVGGNVFKGVGGDVINVHGDYISGEEKIRLPKFVVLKSKYEGRCLRLTENDGSLPTGFLKFEGSEVATEEAKFELVPSKSGKELVHLRCCYNNKYLPAHIRYFGGLHGGSGAPDKDVFNVYTLVAWESLERKINKAVLPRFVVLKSMYNNKYLSLTKNDPLLPTGFLKFDGEEVGNPLVKFEVEKAKIGNRWVHIRCCYNKKYLVRENTPIGTCCYINKTLDCCGG